MSKRINKRWKMYDPETWDYDDVASGRYTHFVYLIKFETGEFYYGKKQIYKGVKDIKKLKSTSIESDWELYTGSSKLCNEMIDSGIEYEKYILHCFKCDSEVSLIEAALILNFGFHPDNLNKAVMVRSRITKNRIDLFNTLQYLIDLLR
ncbi:hypothetical protein ACSTWI_000788 [Escherichia coli]|nr:hypothetical protein [Escherichia coli]